MSLRLMLLLQVSATPPVVPSDFDLKDAAKHEDLLARPEARCPIADGDEIVVCARRNQDYRYRELRNEYPPDIAVPRAEVDLGGGTSAGITADTVSFGSGMVSKRIMVTIKKKF